MQARQMAGKRSSGRLEALPCSPRMWRRHPAGPCSTLQAMGGDPVLLEQYKGCGRLLDFLGSFQDSRLLQVLQVGPSKYCLLRVDHLAAAHAGLAQPRQEGGALQRSRWGSPPPRTRRSRSRERWRHSQSRSRSRSRSYSRSRGKRDGGQRRGGSRSRSPSRLRRERRGRSRSPVARQSAGMAPPCSASGDGGTSVFWDPLWRTERQLLRLLDASGPQQPSNLVAAVDWPPQLPRMDAGRDNACRPSLPWRAAPSPMCACPARSFVEPARASASTILHHLTRPPLLPVL